eukprot:Clim_evm7s217 gene=Clim_evmTU7s217
MFTSHTLLGSARTVSLVTRFYGAQVGRSTGMKELLSYKGIGQKQASKIMRQVGLDPRIRNQDMNTYDRQAIDSQLQDILPFTGRYLVDEMKKNIRRLIEARTWRGQRHLRSLPARGQNTHSNAKTQRRLGPRRVRFEKKGDEDAE